MSDGAAARPLWRNDHCFACGAGNPRGLQLRFLTGEDGASVSWVTSTDWEGFRGIVHGGLVATVLDEAMSQAVASSGCRALTCELRVRLRRHVEAEESLQVRGWVVERRRRRIRAEATLCDDHGIERAHGWATFLEPF
jgi:acyl-coenzyme A thioesterase PaaI-like protein